MPPLATPLSTNILQTENRPSLLGVVYTKRRLDRRRSSNDIRPIRYSRQSVLRERERERQVYLQPDGLDSNTYNTYNINIIKYLQYGRHTGTTNICLLPIVQSPWY